MNYKDVIKELKDTQGITPVNTELNNNDEVYINVKNEDFNKTCLWMHKRLNSPVLMQFAVDERGKDKAFVVFAVFMSIEYKNWFFISMNIPQDKPHFNSLAKDMHSAGLFEREIKEMYGIEPIGNPDTRRLNLHDEVWPDGYYPLRKDFVPPAVSDAKKPNYNFNKIIGEGIFEVPVGPVHAGIIGPGHFRFSSAGEPIINLEIRLGFTHRAVEKLFEGKNVLDAITLAECVSGDSAFAHSTAFCQSIEKICGILPPEYALYSRGIFLELERMYNHVSNIGGIAIDVGFSYPSMYASIIKEQILLLNKNLTGSRYLKNVNAIGGISKNISKENRNLLLDSLNSILKDFGNLKEILYSTVSFMDRVDDTGILKKKTAEDFGITGLAARASGIAIDLRSNFPSIYDNVNFNLIKQQKGDVISRLNVMNSEFEESINLIKQFLEKLENLKEEPPKKIALKEGFGLGYVEGWRGTVLYWLKIDKKGIIERCKIVDASFHNWQGLSYAVLGNIIPDFPLCNKSFDLSYSANDL